MATVSQYLSDWLTLRSSALKPRTVESYADLFRRYVFPAFGGVELSALDPSEITHLLASIVAAGHTRTAELLFVALKAAFRTLEKNPLHRVPRPRHSQQSPVAWDDAQIAVYMGALVGHKHRLALTLGIVLGLRRGEICGLRWEDVDFDANVIHIRRQLVRLDSGQIIECSPKSASSVRTLPVPAGLSPLLRAHRQLPSCRLCNHPLRPRRGSQGPCAPSGASLHTPAWSAALLRHLLHSQRRRNEVPAADPWPFKLCNNRESLYTSRHENVTKSR